MKGEACKILHHRCSVLPMLPWQQQLSGHLQPMATWEQQFSNFRITCRVTINLQVNFVKAAFKIINLLLILDSKIWKKIKKKRKKILRQFPPTPAKKQRDSPMPILPYNLHPYLVKTSNGKKIMANT